MRSRLRLRFRLSEDLVRWRNKILISCLGFILSLSLNLSLLYAATPSLAERVIEHRLANGLTVLMVERHQTPVVSINVTFAVGASGKAVSLTLTGPALLSGPVTRTYARVSD